MAVLFTTIAEFLARLLRIGVPEAFMAMQSDTRGNEANIVYDNRETRETPRAVSGATWATAALLALIVILGALLLNGFFSSLTGGPTGNHGQSDVTARP